MAAVTGLPPAITAAVFVPNPVPNFLAKFKSAVSAQIEPFQLSVRATLAGAVAPPKANAAVAIPAPRKYYQLQRLHFVL